MTKYLILFSMTILLFGCSKESEEFFRTETVNSSGTSTINSGFFKNDKILICHVTGSGYEVIEVSVNAAPFHYKHGDINPDMDGDGFTAIFGALNPCNIGDGGDCDDNDASIYPGAEQICGDGIDNDCNGSTDEIFLEINEECNCINAAGDCRPFSNTVPMRCPRRYAPNNTVVCVD